MPATIWPIVPLLDDDDCGAVSGVDDWQVVPSSAG
jgi:hypothetical protein